MGKTFEVRGVEVLSDDYRWAVNYCVNLDKSDIDRSVNTVVRTGCSHPLLNIGHREICNGLLPSDIGFLIGNNHPRDGNHHHVAADPMIVDAQRPYFGKMDDHRGVGGRYGAQSTGRGW